MRKLLVIEFVSLDGVYQAPGDPSEDREGGFPHGGWQRQYFDDVLGAAAAEGMAAADAQLFGRKTYEIMAAFWPKAPSDDPIAQYLNGVQKYVASRTLSTVEWENTELIRGDVVEAVRALKQQPGNNIGVLGSGDLVQTLMRNDLVDEYSVSIFPLVLGSGKRLFRGGEPRTNLQLVDSKTTGTGGVLLTYRPVPRDG
jgi:dihydrofolate reductase